MSSDPSKKLLIVDDHTLFADGLSLILQTSKNQIVSVVANSATQILNDTEKLVQYDLVLIDLHMPSLDGFSFLSAIRSQNLAVNVAVISGTESKMEIERALLLGANGFIPKDSPSNEMIHAVNQLLGGNRYLPAAWLGQIDFIVGDSSSNLPAVMTDRQRQVLELMQEGLQNKQIALVLGLSVSAVKGHIEKLFKLLSVNNRTACVRTAREREII